ncbi:hypothetical protein BKA64DRAFT_20973 [Cadophora sp. MPI-SDFR-AT-0126]|nr:hypothetical protein BKA64DRAFT_20973 [Leotiomycetes sp. MPI-SDFR-AT-0126]
MSDMAYNHNTEEISSFDYNDEIWQTGTSSSSSDVYSPSGPMDQSDAMVRWANSCQNLLPFDYEAWQFGGTVPDSDTNHREERSSAPISVWEASAQSMANEISRSAQQVPRGQKSNLHQSSSLSYNQSPADSPAGSVSKSPHSRKHLSESALNKRRSQNRESQRSFRERQKLHVVWLEDQVRGLKAKYNELEKDYVHLNCKYRALLERTAVNEEAYTSTDEIGSWSVAPGLENFTEHTYHSS